MIRPDADPLYVEPDDAWDDGWTIGYESASRIRPLTLVALSVAWLVIGILVGRSIAGA